MTGEWWREAFDRDYLDRYAHRDEAGGAREARWARGALDRARERAGAGPLAGGDRVLDLACGAGRHARPLAEDGLRVTGLDWSAALLRAAVADTARVGAHDRAHVPAWVRGDMRRLPFADRTFAAVTQFFTAFGYFETVEEDRRVVREVARVLEPGGAWLLDFLNPAHVRATLVPHSARRVGRRDWLTEDREIAPGDDGRERVVKRIRLERADGDVVERTESVRLYDADDLDALVEQAGLEPAGRWGGLDGAAAGPDAPRQVIAAHRPPGGES